MADGDGGGQVPIEVFPPPRPRAAQALAFAFTAGAAVAGFLGFCLAAGILATLGLVFGVLDFFQTRGTVYVPESTFDSEGKLKSWPKRPAT